MTAIAQAKSKQVAQAKAELASVEAARKEQERLAAEQAECARKEQERIAAEQAECARKEHERLAAERAECARKEQERILSDSLGSGPWEIFFSPSQRLHSHFVHCFLNMQAHDLGALFRSSGTIASKNCPCEN